MNSNYEDKIILDDELLKRLKVSVFTQEKNNVKTKKKTDTEMVEAIRKIIMLEVDKNDN